MRLFQVVALWLVCTGIQAQITVIPTVTHLTSNSTPSAGVIMLSVSGGVSPYTYSWSPGGSTAQNINSMPYSAYMVKVTDGNGDTAKVSCSIGYKVNWDQEYSCEERHDTLLYTGTANWGQAVSKNTLAANTDGWFEYVLKGLNENKFIGFADSLSPMVSNYHDLDYGFYYDPSNKWLYTVYNGSFSFLLHGLPEGSVLRVERVGALMNWKINGVVYGSVTDSSSALKPLKLKAVLGNGVNNLVNVGCSFYAQGHAFFPGYTRLIPTIVHNSIPGANDGSLNVTASQSGAYTYTWQPGSVASSSISSVPAGVYSVTTKDSQETSNTVLYHLGYKVSWDQEYSCEERHDTLLYSGPTAWGQAVSKNTLAANTDGWFEYVLKGLGESKFIGFADSLSPMMGNYTDLDYGFYYDPTNQWLYAANKGSFSFLLRGLPEGSVLRVERVGTVINLKVNGLVYGSVTDSSYALKPLKLKAVLRSNVCSLVNVGCSFYEQGNASFPGYTRLKASIVHASAIGANDGSIKLSSEYAQPLTYTWQPGNVHTNPLSTISAGAYKVSVEDTLHHTSSKYYHVGYKTVWDSLYGCTVSGDTLQTTGEYFWGRALSKNTLAANTDGWLEYVAEDLDKIKIIGFVDSMSADPQNIFDIDYGFYYDAVTGVLYTFSKGNYGYVGSITAGSILRVEREADTILFSINGISLGSTIDPIDTRKPWKIKGIVHSWAGAKIVSMGCSFEYNNTLAVNSVVTGYTNDTIRGSINLNATGGITPYNIAWNNVKLPSSTEMYHALLARGYPAGPDSTIIKLQFDSLKQKEVYTGLMSGEYPVTVYDAANDSLSMVVVVGSELNTLLAHGVTTAANIAHQELRGGKLYAYGQGTDLSVSGSVIAGENIAVLSDGFSLGKESRLEFEMPDTTRLSVGLTPLQAEIPYGVADIRSRVAFSFNGSSYTVYSGNLPMYTGNYVAGDRFAISNGPTGAIKFYKNNTEVWTADFFSIASPGSELLYKVVLESVAARLKNMYTLTPKIYLTGITGTIKDVTCGNPCSGTIDAVGRVKLLSAPVRYELYSEANPLNPVSTVNSFPSGNHAFFTNLCPGKYTVKFYYTYQDLVIYGGTPVTSTGVVNGNFEVAYSPQWTNVTNISIAADKSLTKTGGALFGWDAGASTENFLKSTDNGWIEWTVPTAEGTNAAGFNDIDQSVNFNDIDYANYYHKFNGTAILRKFLTSQNGIPSSPICNYADGQKFRLEKQVTGGVTTIKLLLDGVFVTQFSGITATDYVLDVSMHYMSGTMNNPRVSFGCAPSAKQHAVLKREMDGGYYQLDGTNLRFTLDGEYTSAYLKYKVMDRSQALVISDLTSNVLSNVILNNGDNRYSLDCSSLQSGYYTLEVSNEKKEKLYLRFKR